MATDPKDPRRVERTVLSNGLLVAHQAAPAGAESFSATYIGPAGWAYDPAGQEGLALATAQLLPSGAGPWDHLALDRRLDEMGATLTRRCHPESAEVTVWGPRDLWPKLLEVLAAVVLRPHLTARDLERIRRQILERQLRESTQPESRAESELARTVFPPGHPYRQTGLGTRSSVRGLDRAGVVRFHRGHFTAQEGLVVSTGGPGLVPFAAAVRRAFSEVEVEKAPTRPASPVPVPPTERQRVVPLPGRTQVEIRVGGASVARSSPAYAGVYLANEVLGGRPLLARLFQIVRERHGLAYHASSELQAMRWGGYWAAGAGTGPERTAATGRLVRQEVRRISEETVPSDELHRIRESAIGELPLALETTSGAHELALDIAYHGLPDDFLEQWPRTLRALTPRDVREAAAEGLDARRSVTVIAGPVAAPRR